MPFRQATRYTSTHAASLVRDLMVRGTFSPTATTLDGMEHCRRLYSSAWVPRPASAKWVTTQDPTTGKVYHETFAEEKIGYVVHGSHLPHASQVPVGPPPHRAFS